MNDFDVTIDIIDNATSQVFNTVKYPDVLEKEN
jgi:hypothetical protein